MTADPPAAVLPPQAAERARWRRGQPALKDGPLYPLEQEYSLALPLGYAPRLAAPQPMRGGRPQIAVLLHAFHADLLAEFRAYLDHIPFPADVFVSTDDAAKERAAAACFADWPRGAVETLIVPNRGRDVAPKLVGFGAVHDRYEYVLHLHTKRSAHDSRLVGWRGYLLETLLGSPETVRGVFEAFAQAPRLGLLAPQHIDELRPWIRWSANFGIAEELAGRMGFPLPRRAPLDFPSGSMFWARSAALRPLLDLQLTFADFPGESGQTDGTLAHAIERLYFLACEQAGYDWMKVSARGALHEQRGVIAVDSPEALERFLSRHRLRLSTLRDESRAIEDSPVITTPPPAPRRVLHVLWRRVLGDELSQPAMGRLAVVLPAEDEPTVRSVQEALRRLPPGTSGEMVGTPVQALGDGARRNAALRDGFATGAGLVLLLEVPGLMHPDGAAALMRMHQAQDGRAVLEAARLPQLAPKPVDAEDFGIAWAGGPALAIPRAVFEATGGFDEHLTGRYAFMDFSWRARALGFCVRHCPRALYLVGAADAETEPQLLASGLMLAAKWGDVATAARFKALLHGDDAPSGRRAMPLPPEWQVYADFAADPALADGRPD